MSYTTNVKEELTRVAPVCSHCERATLAALVRIDGTLLLGGAGKRKLELNTDAASIGRLIIRLLHEVYGLKTELTVRRSVLHKTPNFLIGVPMQPGMTEALDDMGLLNGEVVFGGIKPELVAKECCAAAYLRGVFLGSGFISDPKGDFHFEITIENEEHAHGIVELMADKGIEARMTQRRNSFLVYMKNATAILEFLAFSGAHHAALEMENQRVLKSVRNEVNRMANAEVANLAKASNAAVEQVFAIRKVVEAVGMENLPAALQEFIVLRVKNPQASMKELGELSNPPLSKSAITHRARRIVEMARELDKH